MSLLLPRHVMEATQRSRASNAAAVTAPASPLSKHRMNTDDFVSSDEISAQVADFVEHKGVTPTPAGWSVMVLMITIPEVTAGGLIMDQEYTDMRTKASPQGIVVGVGPVAYNHSDDRFPTGAWCKVGDRVLYGRYAGKAFQLSNGQELAFLSDTDIIATVEGGWLTQEVADETV